MRIKSLFILITATTLLLTGCEKETSTHSEPSAIPITATLPVVKDVSTYIGSIGTLHASVSIPIKPQVSGKLSQIFVKEGDWVNKDAPLFKIDDSQYLIKLRENQAQLAISKADLEASQKKFHRFQELARKDLVAQTEWDDLQAQQIKSNASIQLQEARLKAAEMDLNDCTIYSPISGRVGKIDLHPGSLVSEGQAEPLVTLSKIDPLKVEFTITEKEFPKITNQTQHVEICPLCELGDYHQGQLTFFDTEFDKQTGLLLVRGIIPNQNTALRPGQSVKVQVPIAIQKEVLLIPQKSIRFSQEGPYVYVVEEGMKIALRQVVLGDEHGKDQIVLEGLTPTETVVVEGHLRISPGTKVEIKS